MPKSFFHDSARRRSSGEAASSCHCPLQGLVSLEHLALISPMKNGLKAYSNRVSNAFFTKGFYSNRGSNARFKRENLFEPLFASHTPRGRYFGSADLRLLTFDDDPFPIPSIYNRKSKIHPPPPMIELPHVAIIGKTSQDLPS